MQSLSTADLIPDHIIINVYGESIHDKIVYSWDKCKDCPEGEKVYPGVFPFGDAEIGKDLKIQALAVYKDSTTSDMVFYYGNFSGNFSGSPIEIAVTDVGSTTGAVSGKISGRYLTGTDTGPTGTIEISYDFAASDAFSPLVIERSSIVNGWFSVFALTGMQFTYTVAETGEVLWGKPMSLDSDEFDPSYSPDSGATYPQFNHVAKAYSPIHLEDHSGITVIREAQILVWGYWGNAAGNASSKRVCTPYLSTNTTRAKRYMTAGASFANSSYLSLSRLLTPGLAQPSIAELLDDSSDANAYSYLVIEGGQNMTGGCYSYYSSTDKYLNYFRIEPEFFDGVGNDQAAGFNGIFAYQNVSGFYTSVSLSGSPAIFHFNLLPGVESVISDVTLYTLPSTKDYQVEVPKCDGSEGLANISLAGSAALTATTTSVDIQTPVTSSQIAAGIFGVVCYKNKNTSANSGLILKRHEVNTAL